MDISGILCSSKNRANLLTIHFKAFPTKRLLLIFETNVVQIEINSASTYHIQTFFSRQHRCILKVRTHNAMKMLLALFYINIFLYTPIQHQQVILASNGMLSCYFCHHLFLRHEVGAEHRYMRQQKHCFGYPFSLCLKSRRQQQHLSEQGGMVMPHLLIC